MPDHSGQSDVLDRGRTASVAGDDDVPAPLAVTAALAACWATCAGLVLCVTVSVLGWLVGSTGSVADAVRVGGQAWLLGQGSGLRVGSTDVTAVPLGLTLLSAALLWRASAWASSRARVTDARGAGSGTVIVAAVFAIVATLTALLTGTASAAVSPVRAFLTSLLLAGVVGGLGMLRGADLLEVVWCWLPEDARAALRGGAAAVLAVLAVATLLVSAALTTDFGDAANVAHSMDAGVVGGAIVTLAGVLLLPNAGLLAVTYLLGPGFAFGTGTAVAPSGVTLGRVPAFPLVAALPDQGTAPVWAVGLLAVPVCAGAFGACLALRHHPAPALPHAALRGALAGLLAGVAVGTLPLLAGGSIGPGRMADIGAQAPACVATATVAMALGGAVGAVLAHWRAQRRTAVSG